MKDSGKRMKRQITDQEKMLYLQIAYSTKDMYLGYINNSQNATVKFKKSNLEFAKDVHTSPKRTYKSPHTWRCGICILNNQ